MMCAYVYTYNTRRSNTYAASEHKSISYIKELQTRRVCVDSAQGNNDIMMAMLHCGGEGFFFRLANRLNPSRVCVRAPRKINHRHRRSCVARRRPAFTPRMAAAPRVYMYVYVKGFTFTKASFCGKPFVVFHIGFWLLLLLQTAYIHEGRRVR